ncbi:MAG: pilus assembly PilX N-terminal domain-containing protein [Magnetococcus sp. YQC-5]
MDNSANKGSALIGVLSVVVVAGTLVAVASRMSQTAVQGSQSTQVGAEALHVAESGLEAARYAISQSQCSTASPVTSGNVLISGRGEYNYTYTYAVVGNKPTWTITSTGYVPSMANAQGKHVLNWTVDACYPECPGGPTFPVVTYPATPDIIIGSSKDEGKDEGKDEDSKDDDKNLSDTATMNPHLTTNLTTKVTANSSPNSTIYDHVIFLAGASNHGTLNSTVANNANESIRYDVKRMDPDAAQSTINWVAANYFIKTFDVGGDTTNLNTNGGSGGTELKPKGVGKVNFFTEKFYSRQNSEYNYSKDDDGDKSDDEGGKDVDCNAEKAKKLTIYVYDTAWFDANNQVCGVIRGCGPNARLLFSNGNIDIKGGITGIWANGVFNANGVYNTPTRITSGFGIDGVNPPSNTNVTTYADAINNEIPPATKMITRAKDWKADYK